MPSSTSQTQNIQSSQVLTTGSSIAAESSSPLTQPKQNIFLQSIPIILLVFFFYFVIIRPQQKRSKELSMMIKEIKIGSKILTSGGIYGTVTDFDKTSDLVKIEISKNVRVVIAKSSIITVFRSDELDLS